MTDNGSHSEFDRLLTRYLSGELSEAERQQFDEMVGRDAGLQRQLEEFRQIWDSTGTITPGKSYDLDAEWDQLRGQLPGFGSSSDYSLETESPATGRGLLFYTYRIAAALIVGLLFAFAWIYGTRMAGSELVVAGNEPVELVLEDGSQVILNRESKLRYRIRSHDDERRIRLSGEAWFDVARDTSRPFIIDAGEALVEVLGTSFNVNAYRENPRVEITVESGVVALTPKQDQGEQIVLKAGNGGTFDRESKHLELIPDSNPNTISWKTKELFFTDASLQEVADVVSHAYGVHLRVDPNLEDCLVTVTFRDQSLEAILNVLEQTLDLEISRTGNLIRLGGEGCAE